MQLLLMNHSSIFVNDSAEAGRVLREIPSKGSIYHVFRFDSSIPDLMSSDGEEYAKRRPLVQALQGLSADTAIAGILQQFISQLSDEVIDIDKIYSLLAFDLVAKVIFQYDLQAISGAAQGQRLYTCQRIFADHASSQAIYPNPVAGKVTSEEVLAAKADWMDFLVLLAEHVKRLASEGEDSFLAQLTASDGDSALLSEVHQLFKHGYEMLSGAMMWITFAFAKHKRIREKVEAAILQQQKGFYPEYLECFLKEIMRRYPVAGNLTVRTPSQPFAIAGTQAPADVPVHVHMFSLHNTSREWERAKDFMPERWMNSAAGEPGHPKCPFASGKSAFDGAGFREGCLSYFPFSVGQRACPGQGRSLHILRQFLLTVASSFHLDFADAIGWEDDPGVSMSGTIIPLNPKVLQVRALRILDLKKLVNQEEGGLAEVKAPTAAAAAAAAAAAVSEKQGE